MRKIYTILILLISLALNAQDVSMVDGQFERCQPDRLFDSGGEFGNYGSNEDIVTTICAINPGDFVQLNFTEFSTQLNVDILEVYDGDNITAPLIGSYSGAAGPGLVEGTSSSGCLTVRFTSNDSGVTTGFAADISCATPCQAITALIDSTNPPVNASNEIEIDPGEIVDFFGSATFSNDGTGATYEWNFDDGTPPVNGTDTSHAFATFGTYNVTLTVTDNNPLGCSDTISVTVIVRDNDECLGALPICSGIDNVPSPVGDGTAEPGIDYDCLGSQPDPRWYFLQTGDTPGNLNFTLTQYSGPNETGSGNDVDFIIWGPFDEPQCGTTNLNSSSQVDCSFSADFIENINIPNAPANSLYILLITNYSQNDGFINLNLDPSSTADTDCDIICQADLGDDQDLCNGEELTLAPDFSGTFTDFVWQLNGVDIPGETNSTLTVTEGGIYTLIANGVDAIFGDPCETQDDIEITLLEEDASFTVEPNCIGASVNITGDIGGSFAFNPLPTDGAVIDSATGEVTNAISGNSYTIEYTTSGACPGISSQEFTVLDNDDATFTITPTCEGATASITGTTGGSFSFNPDLGDGAVIDANTGTVTGGVLGTVYTVEYATSGPCSDATTQTFSIIPADNPSFSLSPDCTGATATISGDTGGAFAFNPDLGDGAVIDSSTGTISDAVPSASYTVEYTTAGPCVQTSQETVTILPSEDATFEYTPNCTGATATILGDTGGTFTFNTGSGSDPVGEATLDAVTGEIANATPGFSYAVDYTTSGPCPATETVVVTVFDQDDSSFTLTPTCDGAIATINGLIGGNFAFNPPPADGAVINANTGTITNGDFDSTYTVEYTTIGDCPTTTSQTVTVFPEPIAISPSPLEVCDDGTPDGITFIDLTLKNPEITGGNPNYSVSYHLTSADALSGIAPLGVPYENQSNGQVVFARVEDTATGCFATVGLTLTVQQAPVANAPSPLEFCDPDSDGFGTFDLTERDLEITGGDTTLGVTYHETPSDAQNGVNAVGTVYDNIDPFSQTLYVRVESPTIATDCASFTELGLVVSPTPQLGGTPPAPLGVCDGPEADGIAQFDLDSKRPEILQALDDPALYTVSYHLGEADAQLPANAIANVFSYTNTSPFAQEVWVRVEDTATGCFTLTTLALEVDPLPVLATEVVLELCDTGGPNDGTEPFDLSLATSDILMGAGGISLSYHLTQSGADSNTDGISSPYTNVSPAQTVYVRATDDITGCTSTATLLLRVLPVPTPTPDPPGLVLCDDTDPGDLVESFDLTANEALLINGEAGVTPTYHLTGFDADQGDNAIADPSVYENTSTPQTIWARVTNDITGCYTVVDFTLEVDPLPGVPEGGVAGMVICELGTDGQAQFDLSQQDTAILDGQDPSLFTVSYHGGQAGAEDLTGALNSPYTNTSNPQTIYVAVTDNATGCSISTLSFEIGVQEAATANADGTDIVLEACDDNMEFDGDPTNDSAQFDLGDTALGAQVLDNQDPADYTVSYYATEQGALSGTDQIPFLYENLENPQVIWARVDNDTEDASGADTSGCFAVAPVTLRVNPQPSFRLGESYTLCVRTNGTEAIGPPVIDTGLGGPQYAFTWALDGTDIAGATGGSYMPDQPGAYTVTVTDLLTSTATQCGATASTVVVESAPPTVTAEVTSLGFADEHVIEVTATGIGDYEYSLDGGPWQLSDLFEGVSLGDHEVAARDRNGCGLATAEVTVLDYPAFFTPNGDGFNDRWNIAGIGPQLGAEIYIFDRYGKLLKQLSPSGQGWDGTYNGSPMPTSDYWFVVEYAEPATQQRKEFRAHFTLKR